MQIPNTTDKTRQWPAAHEEPLLREGTDPPGVQDVEDQIAALFATDDTRKKGRPGGANPWPIDSRLDTLPGGNCRASRDPIGQFVYQEHNSFFRTRMPTTTHWSVAWSDLMMTMFIFFAVLFVFFSLHHNDLASKRIGSDFRAGVGTGKIGAAGGGGLGRRAVPAEASAEQIFRISKKAIADQKLSDFAQVDLAPDKSIRIALTGDLLFDPGQAELKSRARQSLRNIADLLRRTPYMINVVGHTDDVPIHTQRFPSNWELSMARAGVVARFLIDRMGLPANRFYVTAYASNWPVLRNNSQVNRAANRRVEIVITRDLPEAEYVADPEKVLLPHPATPEMAPTKNNL